MERIASILGVDPKHGGDAFLRSASNHLQDCTRSQLRKTADFFAVLLRKRQGFGRKWSQWKVGRYCLALSSSGLLSLK
jgi:hypothetical protein